MKNHPHLLAALAVAFAGTASAQYFTDNFDSLSTGAYVGATPPNFGGANPNFATTVNTNTSITVEQDTGNLFGLGTGNKYIRINDNNINASNSSAIFFRAEQLSQMSGQIYTFSIDIYEPDNGYAAPGGFAIRFGTDGATANISVDSAFNNGALSSSGNASFAPTYSTNTAYTLTYVINDSASGTTYGPGDRALASQTFDLWMGPVGGTQILLNSASGLAYRNAGITLEQRITLTTFGNTRQEMLVDNISFQAGAIAPIPEPSSFAALAGLGALALCTLRRRHR